MSLYSDIMQQAAVTNNAIFGDAASYYVDGVMVDPVSCTVEVEFEVELQPEGYEATAMERVTTIQVLLSEIGAAPGRGDIFTVGPATYIVRRLLENNGQFAQVIVNAQ